MDTEQTITIDVKVIQDAIRDLPEVKDLQDEEARERLLQWADGEIEKQNQEQASAEDAGTSLEAFSAWHGHFETLVRAMAVFAQNRNALSKEDFGDGLSAITTAAAKAGYRPSNKRLYAMKRSRLRVLPFDTIGDLIDLVTAKSGKASKLRKEEVNKRVSDMLDFYEVLLLDDDETELIAEYNEEIRRDLGKYMPLLLQQRGIRSQPLQIDKNDPQVKRFIKSKMEREERKKLHQREINHIVDQVQIFHGEQLQLAIMQISSWAVLRRNLFKIKETAQGVGLEYHVNVEVPERYWGSDEDPLDKLLGNYTLLTPQFDKNNHLEFMVAVVTTIMDENPLFTKRLMGLLKRVIGSVMTMQRATQVDDAGFLDAALEGLLRLEVGRADSDGVRDDAGGGVSAVSGDSEAEEA